jgi:hypothetical protein
VKVERLDGVSLNQWRARESFSDRATRRGAGFWLSFLFPYQQPSVLSP